MTALEPRAQASIRSLDDVAAICEAFGLRRLDDPDRHPDAWLTADRTIGVAVSGLFGSMTGLHVQRIRDWDEGDAVQLAEVKPYTSEAADLLTAVLKALIPEARA